MMELGGHPRPRLRAATLLFTVTACVSPTVVVSPATATIATATAATPGSTIRLGDRPTLPAGHVVLRPTTTSVGATTIAWARLGAGTPLILLNGTASPMADWDPALLAALSRRREVIVFDYPGLGSSGPAATKFTFADMADSVASLIEATGIGRTDVLGWSMGGFVAQELLRRHPDLVRRAVLAATNPGGSAATLGPKWVQDIDSDPDAGLGAYFRTNYPRTRCAQRSARGFVRRVNAAIKAGRYPPSDVPATTAAAMVAAEDQWLNSDSNWAALRRIRQPVMLMTGADDLVTPARNSRVIARRVPGASLLSFRGAGHSFLFQDPRLVANETLRFLDSRVGQVRLRRSVETACSRAG